MQPDTSISRAGHAATGTRRWLRWLPGLAMLKEYQASWLPRDIAAGLVLTTMLVPVGIAYAEASGVPGVYGLYATIVPLLVYAVFGPSRILVLGPDSALAAPILALVISMAPGDPARSPCLAPEPADARYSDRDRSHAPRDTTGSGTPPAGAR